MSERGGGGGDTGREAVYAAEIAAFDGTSYESVVALEVLIEIGTKICTADWWPHGEIDVVAARSDARSSSTRQRGSTRPVIRLAAPQMTRATLIHEFAHVLAGVKLGHSPVFRRAYIDLAGFVFGADEARWLVDAFDAIGLGCGERRWPSPTLRRVSGGPIAL